MNLRIALLFTAIPSCSIFAQDTLKTLPLPPQVDFSAGIIGTILKLIFSLVAIVGLIYLSIYLLKRISNKTMPSAEQWVKVISKSHLTPKQSLFIVKLGLRYSVLGVGENSINLIRELTPEEADSLKPSVEKSKNFQSIFKSVLRK